jgi:hypothetical protein
VNTAYATGSRGEGEAETPEADAARMVGETAYAAGAANRLARKIPRRCAHGEDGCEVAAACARDRAGDVAVLEFGQSLRAVGCAGLARERGRRGRRLPARARRGRKFSDQ